MKGGKLTYELEVDIHGGPQLPVTVAFTGTTPLINIISMPKL